jgi:hypothetical protein
MLATRVGAHGEMFSKPMRFFLAASSVNGSQRLGLGSTAPSAWHRSLIGSQTARLLGIHRGGCRTPFAGAREGGSS